MHFHPIGRHVLMQACEACKRWNDNGHPDYKVNVNLSVVQLLQQDIVEIVADIVKSSRIDPHNLTLEVTEGLNVSICVEGIETEKQYRVLEGMNVRMIQGYYFDKPMPAAVFEKKYLS